MIHVGTGDTAIGDTGADTYVLATGLAGEIRLIGDAQDTIDSAATGWVATGTAILDGTRFDGFQSGGLTLWAGTGTNTGDLALAPGFGTTVQTAGYDRQVIDLTSLSPSRGFIIQGDTAGDYLGISLSSAGDVNGDGFDDIIVGAFRADDGGTNAGEAYVIFGTAAGFGTTDGQGRQVIDLTSLSAAQGFIIQGETGDGVGVSVARAGDVNGDGFDDMIAGAYFGNGGGSQAGEAYVIFGSADGFGTTVNTGGHDRQVLDVATLTSAQGFIIQGDTTSDRLGQSVSSAGDINGDGFDDLIVGARLGDDGGSDAGEAYVIFGSASGFGTADGQGRQVIDVTLLTQTQGFIIQGDTDGDHAGHSVASAGDVNGDGFDDLIVGARMGDDGDVNAGEAYVIFGTSGGFGTADSQGRQVIDLTTLAASQGFIIQGDAASDYAGAAVATAGDVNGDGFGDLIVGAWRGDDGDDGAGEAYVVFGTATGFGTADGQGRQVIDLTTLAADQGFIIQGDATSDYAGTSVSTAGDVNGDGLADLIISATRGDDGGNNAGKAYVVFGSSTGFGTTDGQGRQVIDLTALSSAQGFIIQGDTIGDSAGVSVSSAGDINGDGFSDLAVGAPLGDDGGSSAGEAYVIFGGPDGFSLSQVAGTDGDDDLTGTGAAERLIGGRGNDVLTGNGGGDVFIGGQGDDIIDVGSGNFARIDGGTGSDTLRTVAGLDFTLIEDGLVKGIELIDVNGNGSQVLTLDARDVLAFEASNRDVLGTMHDNVLMLTGEAVDGLILTGMGPATETIFSGSNYWDLYAINGKVVLAVDADMSLI